MNREEIEAEASVVADETAKFEARLGQLRAEGTQG
jgi:hypothetical protein